MLSAALCHRSTWFSPCSMPLCKIQMKKHLQSLEMIRKGTGKIRTEHNCSSKRSPLYPLLLFPPNSCLALPYLTALLLVFPHFSFPFFPQLITRAWDQRAVLGISTQQTASPRGEHVPGYFRNHPLQGSNHPCPARRQAVITRLFKGRINPLKSIK